MLLSHRCQRLASGLLRQHNLIGASTSAPEATLLKNEASSWEGNFLIADQAATGASGLHTSPLHQAGCDADQFQLSRNDLPTAATSSTSATSSSFPRVQGCSLHRSMPAWTSSPRGAGAAPMWSSRCFSASTEVADNNGSAAVAGGSSLAESGNGEAEAAPKAIRGLPGIRELTEAMEAKLNGRGGIALTKPEKRVMQACLENFANSSWVQSEALELYVNSELLVAVMAAFRKLIRRGITAELRDALCETGPGQQANSMLFPIFAEMVLQDYKTQITAYRKLVQSADLRLPHSWYPMARSMRRRLIYHGGPTNSGKTHNALVAMQKAESGVYCGPLRLLAMEIFDRTNADGLFCSLLTGQEKQIVPGSQHTACTIEMVSTTQQVDVAVIDEIQMIGDPYRGWAWTRALQGVPASEIHLCGDLSALQLVKQIAKETGDELEIHTYDRFTKLEIEKSSLEEIGGYSNVQAGDCVVAFSRRDIYAIKSVIEAETGLRVCVVYGALPPEMRRIQAQLFNDPDSGYDVMVASDAVGMGMNLNIRRIVFHTMQKFEGTETVPVSVSMVKQIAGRAGRRSSEFSNGFVTCFRTKDMEALREALAVPISSMNTPLAGLFPEFEQIELFASQVPGLPFPMLLRRFSEESRLDGKFFFCKQDPLIDIAKLLENVPELSLRDRYDFCTAPVNTRDQTATSHLLRIAIEYCRGESCTLDLEVPEEPPSTNDELKALESQHHLTSLWLCLATRFSRKDTTFLGREATEETAAKIITLMSEALAQMSQSGIDRTGSSSRSRRHKGGHHHALLAPHSKRKPHHTHHGRNSKHAGSNTSSSHSLLATLNQRLKTKSNAQRQARAQEGSASP